MKYKVKDLANEISVRENNPKESIYDKFVGLEHYDSGEMSIHRFADSKKMNSSAKIFLSGDILIARRNVYLRRAGIVSFDGLTSGDSIVIRAKNDIYRKILPFILNTNKFWNYATKYADGTMSKRLSPELLMEYEFNLPETDKDIDKLSKSLWSVSTTIDSYKEMIHSCDVLLHSKFNDLSKLEQNIVNLDSLALTWSKGQMFKKDDINQNGEQTCIHYGELFTKYGPIINKVLSKTDVKATKKSKKGDILFPASDVTPNGLARCSVINFDDVLLGGDIIVMRPIDEVNPIYLSYAIIYQKEQLLKRVTGSVVKHISSSSLKTVRIPLIDKTLQDEFSIFAKTIENIKEDYTDNIAKLSEVQKKLIYNNLEKGD